MQSEYPVSVLIVVAACPGPVEQKPEPTTPTGPPSPAAAAAATLSRYHGYIFLTKHSQNSHSIILNEYFSLADTLNERRVRFPEHAGSRGATALGYVTERVSLRHAPLAADFRQRSPL